MQEEAHEEVQAVSLAEIHEEVHVKTQEEAHEEVQAVSLAEIHEEVHVKTQEEAYEEVQAVSLTEIHEAVQEEAHVKIQEVNLQVDQHFKGMSLVLERKKGKVKFLKI